MGSTCFLSPFSAQVPLFSLRAARAALLTPARGTALRSDGSPFLLPAEPVVDVVVLVVEPEVVFVVDLEVSEPGVVFVAVVSVADVAEPQASVDIAVAFVVLVPVSVVVVEVDSSGRPRFLAFPNVDYYASSSSSVEVVGRNPFIVPPVPVPIMVSVVSSPTWVYIKIKTWNIVIITPAPVIIM